MHRYMEAVLSNNGSFKLSIFLDINECLSGNFGCSDNCINTDGGAHCSCPKGFKLKKDRKHCTGRKYLDYYFLTNILSNLVH